MADVRYLQTVGGFIRLHYTDGTTNDAYPDGRGHYLPRITSTWTPTDPPSGIWTHPLPGSSITSQYGPRELDGFHYGLDLSSPSTGNLCLAITDMKVVQAVPAGTGQYDESEYAKLQTLDGAYTFSYFHMVAGSLQVSVGDILAPGDPIGTEGATGNVTGRHLHLECYAGAINDPWYSVNQSEDPLPVLRENGVGI